MPSDIPRCNRPTDIPLRIGRVQRTTILGVPVGDSGVYDRLIEAVRNCIIEHWGNHGLTRNKNVPLMISSARDQRISRGMDGIWCVRVVKYRGQVEAVPPINNTVAVL